MNKSNFLFFSVLLSVFFLAGMGLGYFLWGPTSAQAKAQVVAAVQATQAAVPTSDTTTQAAADQQQVKRYDIPIDGNPVLGSNDAPITIIEFSDYQCPYCKKWAVEVYKPLLEKYGSQIRFVYRDFPLTSIHPEALPAAIAADCAGEQDRYYDYHDQLFFGSYTLGADAYQKYAVDMGLDAKKFAECLSSKRYEEEVMADLDWATNLGVRSTPTFFINGIPLVGAQPFEVFDEVIGKELAGEIPK